MIAARIASSPGAVRLGGDKRPVAVLFSDIRGFAELSETMNPDEMASLLSEYFTEMVECVFRNDGTLDKFIGDAVMAQWGAPIGTADDADRAVRAAIDMMRALEGLNANAIVTNYDLVADFYFVHWFAVGSTVFFIDDNHNVHLNMFNLDPLPV